MRSTLFCAGVWTHLESGPETTRPRRRNDTRGTMLQWHVGIDVPGTDPQRRRTEGTVKAKHGRRVLCFNRSQHRGDGQGQASWPSNQRG